VNRSRARVERLVPGLFTLFLATSVAPWAVLFVHRHDGDGHAHVHAWGADAAAARRVGLPHRHAHPLEVGPLEHEGWHSHFQAPFQISAPPSMIATACSEAIAALVVPVERPVGRVPLRSRVARAPPAFRSV